MVCVALSVLTGCSHYRVFSVKDSPLFATGGGAIYALPATSVVLTVSVEHRDFSSANHKDFAVDFLGVDSPDIEEGYKVGNIRLHTVNVADADYCYYVKIRRGSIATDDNHLLMSVGIQPDAGRQTVKETYNGAGEKANSPLLMGSNLYDRPDTFYVRGDVPGKPSKVSFRKDVRNSRMRAQNAANRIEELADRRKQLVEEDHEMTAEQMAFSVRQIDAQIEGLYESFCGRVVTDSVTISYLPKLGKQTQKTDTLAWFSPTDGLYVEQIDGMPSDAVPILCTVKMGDDMRAVSRFVRFRTTGRLFGSSAGRSRTKCIKYRVPVSAEILVQCGEYECAKELMFSQFGPTVDLPRRRVKALFDANSHDLKYLGR